MRSWRLNYSACSAPAPRVRENAPRARRDQLARYRQRLAAIEKIDFFGSAGRDRVQALLAAIEGGSGGGKRRTGERPDVRRIYQSHVGDAADARC